MAVILLVFAITTILSAYVYTTFNTELGLAITAGDFATPAALGTVETQVLDVVYGLDTVIVVLYFALNAAALVSAYFVRSHPIFFVLSLFIMAFFIVGSVVMSNVYYAVASVSVLAPIANNFPFIYTLFTYLPVITLCMSGLLAIVTYGRQAGGGGVQYSY